MGSYSFDRFSVLVAEDNTYLRSLLAQSLKAIGVGNIRSAEHGGEAIDILRMMAIDPTKAGLMHVDIILSNWQMSPVDGLMLLRWVRRHKESPNRFIPFIMVTGYADQDKVNEARDMGVTEILAKPFSVSSMAQRLLQVIDRPRQFVHTPDYFGPDRRRQNLGTPTGEERRQMSEEDIEIVYA
jgi:CheY-like chemotaxis protein